MERTSRATPFTARGDGSPVCRRWPRGQQLGSPEFAGRLDGRRQLLDPLGEAEVHDLHVPLLGQHDVGGLQIAMEKPAGMRLPEAPTTARANCADLSIMPRRSDLLCSIAKPVRCCHQQFLRSASGRWALGGLRTESMRSRERLATLPLDLVSSCGLLPGAFLAEQTSGALTASPSSQALSPVERRTSAQLVPGNRVPPNFQRIR